VYVCVCVCVCECVCEYVCMCVCVCVRVCNLAKSWYPRTGTLPVPMDHVKYLRAGPSNMPLRSWYNCGTNHFEQADLCLAK